MIRGFILWWRKKMLFNSYIFIFVFLPLAVAGYYVLHRFEYKNVAKIWLIGMSLWFYGYNNPMYLLVIGCSVVFNYLISKLFYCEKIKTAGRKVILAGGVFANLLSIFFFKYYDFFIENIKNTIISFGTTIYKIKCRRLIINQDQTATEITQSIFF